MLSPKRKQQISAGSAISILFALSLLLAACGGATATPGAGGDGGGEVATSAPTDASGSTEGGLTSGLCASDYYPVVAGTTWTYSGTGFSGDFTWTSTITDVSETGFTLTNYFTDVTTTQQWSCTTEGLAALAYGGGPEATLNVTGGVSGTYETVDTTGVTFPAHIATGDTWEQSFTIHGELDMSGESLGIADGTVTQSYVALGLESVTVPAGSFEAMKVQATLAFDLQVSLQGLTVPMDFSSDTTNWWVQGIGWVKSESSATFEGAESFEANTQLESYSIP
jgi:hypothetical protein